MAFYINHRQDSVFTSVEFTPALDGNFSFFRIRDDASLADAKKQLASMGQVIVAETKVDGRPMIVVRGKRTDYSILETLKEAGDDLQPPEADHSVKPWKLRGWASMVGQPLQLLSSFLTKPKGIDGATAGFATLNIIANITNIVFGAEHTKDTHQLQHLKRKFNYQISQYLPDGASSMLPGSTDDRLALRKTKEDVPSLGTRVIAFLRRNSVSFCEIGLRYIGSVILIFPIAKWRKGMSAFGDSLKVSGKGGYGKALLDGAVATYNSEDKNTARVGLAYVAGKTLAFTSKIPDPFDPKPHTMIDTIREKVVFPLSSTIEATAAGFLSYDRVFKRTVGYTKIANLIRPLVERFTEKGIETPWFKKISETVEKDGKIMAKYTTRDWFGGIGGALFTAGLITRIFAKFGVKEVDIKELNAHIVDGLAHVPPEKLPQLIADFSAYLADHFKGTVEFGEVYKQLTDGLYKYHQIAVPGLQLVSGNGKAADQMLPQAKQTEEKEKEEPFATPDKKAPRTAIPQYTSHQERAASPSEGMGLADGRA